MPPSGVAVCPGMAASLTRFRRRLLRGDAEEVEGAASPEAAGSLCWGWGGAWPAVWLVMAAVVLVAPWHILAKCPVFWHLLQVALKALQDSACFWPVWGESPQYEHLF